MLHEFLELNRQAILKLCQQKLTRLANTRDSSIEMDSGLPTFYDELIEVLRDDASGLKTRGIGDDPTTLVQRSSAIRRGGESLALGYSLSQVVHGYGALCQAITQYAGENSDIPITAREFNRLNFCLDIAIAEAVTEYARVERENTERAEVLRLGFLAHELRNALSHAAIAHRMLKSGSVGASGSTAQILGDAHTRMKNLIDRSLTEVRLRTEPIVEHQRCRVLHLISDVEVTAFSEASAKAIELRMEIAPDLEVFADRQLIISAISNLVQNAIKFTKVGGSVWIRARAVAARVIIEVEDQCGGLPPGKVEELFKPYTQRSSDQSGMGLGLRITQRAVALNNGILSVRDLPNRGCIFTIDLPLAVPCHDRSDPENDGEVQICH